MIISPLICNYILREYQYNKSQNEKHVASDIVLWTLITCRIRYSIMNAYYNLAGDILCKLMCIIL